VALSLKATITAALPSAVTIESFFPWDFQLKKFDVPLGNRTTTKQGQSSFCFKAATIQARVDAVEGRVAAFQKNGAVLTVNLKMPWGDRSIFTWFGMIPRAAVTELVHIVSIYLGCKTSFW
jgi:hypothetical protein